MTTAPETTPERIIRARHGFVAVDFKELWRYRELFLFLAWRDILVRYKQTVLGVAWAVLQPLLTVVVFSVIFDKLAKFPSYGTPYAVLTLVGLIPWQFFSTALTDSSNSLVASSNLVSKIYFPRLIVPLSAILCGFVDFLIGMIILMAFMWYYGVPFRPQLIVLPFFILMGVTATFTAGTWLSALNVRYRDVKYVVPFFVRLGFYISPVGFASSLISQKFGNTVFFWYCGLNPMVSVIDGFRWCVLGGNFVPFWPGVVINVATIFVFLTAGLFYFRRTEKTFADVI